ncbi:MBL fold metallo-hydrolase [Pseudonocardia endophytica]|uniref:L-ascorbate metabolism protein UlaG (Beta-lactamase superfamily) n=1 Tax=Pseudonocardia endophytica TaxID=401976 RepID=A0A4R1HJM9_PSEEN|nr:MBL fold metallo-hydrolase [Pseudonocardia endophytica]TCK22574.1 L-ascorbate metabolism protein UlaG (beta-lactamase superfamily) [Pseudonocardia endophytica]
MPSPRVPLIAASTLTGIAGATWWFRRNAGAYDRSLRAVTSRSPHATDGIFANTEPGEPRPDVSPRRVVRMVRHRNEVGVPPGRVPLAPLRLPARPAALAATWLGHAGVLLEIDGRRVLVDPVWSKQVSPVPFIGPRRLHPAPGPLSALTALAGGLDAVLISHDHYDHLDVRTVRRLAADTTATFVAPLGVGEHLRRWGVPAARIVQCDWDETADVAGLRLTCLEARHFSGRWLRRNTTQWGAWSVAGPQHRVYAGGDTGPTGAFARSGAAHGPFDLTLLPIGAYATLWPDVHMTPEQAVDAHLALRGDVLVPIHWASFNLGFHAWAEPAERLARAASDASVTVAFPRVGGRVEPGSVLPDDSWWTVLD